MFRNVGFGGFVGLQEGLVAGEVVTANTGLHVHHVAHQLAGVGNHSLGMINPLQGLGQRQDLGQEGHRQEHQQNDRYRYRTA